MLAQRDRREDPGDQAAHGGERVRPARTEHRDDEPAEAERDRIGGRDERVVRRAHATTSRVRHALLHDQLVGDDADASADAADDEHGHRDQRDREQRGAHDAGSLDEQREPERRRGAEAPDRERCRERADGHADAPGREQDAVAGLAEPEVVQRVREVGDHAAGCGEHRDDAGRDDDREHAVAAQERQALERRVGDLHGRRIAPGMELPAHGDQHDDAEQQRGRGDDEQPARADEPGADADGDGSERHRGVAPRLHVPVRAVQMVVHDEVRQRGGDRRADRRRAQRRERHHDGQPEDARADHEHGEHRRASRVRRAPRCACG